MVECLDFGLQARCYFHVMPRCVEQDGGLNIGYFMVAISSQSIVHICVDETGGGGGGGALFMLLKYNFFFSGLHFYTLPKTLIACRAMQLRFV